MLAAPDPPPHPSVPPSSDVASLRGFVRQLVDHCHGNNREIRSSREEVSQNSVVVMARFIQPT